MGLSQIPNPKSRHTVCPYKTDTFRFHSQCFTVLEAVRAVKPTALIGVRRHKHSLRKGALAGPEGGELAGYREDSAGGVAGGAGKADKDGKHESPPRLFTREVLVEMGKNTDAPLIFALSRPEGIAECSAQDAYHATDGRCVFVPGCPVEPFVDAATKRLIAPRPSTSAYVFPGFAMGVSLAEANRVRSPMFLAAAEAVASLVTDEDLAGGAVYPRTGTYWAFPKSRHTVCPYKTDTFR